MRAPNWAVERFCIGARHLFRFLDFQLLFDFVCLLMLIDHFSLAACAGVNALLILFNL
jgi:hypothetical protein